MEWLEEKCFELISMYQQHELLWLAKHPLHYNKLKKQDAWEEISKEINADPEECKKKIASLLLSFRRENAKIKKSRKTGTGRDDIYESCWFAFKAKLFLQDKDDPRPRLNTLSGNDNFDSFEEKEAAPAETAENENQTPPPSVENFDRRPLPSKLPSRKSRKINDERLDKAFNMLQASASMASSLPQNESEHDIFGKLVAKKLQSYSPNVNSIVQEEVMKVLFKADRGWYNSNNQQLPSQTLFHSNPQPCYSNFSHPNPPYSNICLAVTPGQTSPSASTPTSQSSPIGQY